MATPTCAVVMARRMPGESVPSGCGVGCVTIGPPLSPGHVSIVLPPPDATPPYIVYRRQGGVVVSQDELVALDAVRMSRFSVCMQNALRHDLAGGFFGSVVDTVCGVRRHPPAPSAAAI